MDKQFETINSLNQMLQGEYMAVDVFNIFISKTEEETVKKTFQEVQDNHRQNIMILTNYIQELGGKPHENLGIQGTMADIKINMQLGSQADVSRVIREAIKGETTGINISEKLVRGNLDERSRDLTGKILHQDRQSLDQLRKLLH
jgi:bacterioferritin